MEMTVFVVFILVLTVGFQKTCESRHTLNCKLCGFANCINDPIPFCMYGHYVDQCGRTKCAKGPGERCGGPSNFLGECGDGMFCHEDEKCYGCSLHTLNCHSRQE